MRSNSRHAVSNAALAEESPPEGAAEEVADSPSGDSPAQPSRPDRLDPTRSLHQLPAGAIPGGRGDICLALL